MPFDSAFDDIYKFGIKGAADDVGAYAERVDEQIFNEGILDRIFNQISKADVIVADMTGRNPNVFYEVGYAHALGKTVVLLTQRTEDIPFDLQHPQHTVYAGKIDALRAELGPKIQWAIAESKRLQLGGTPERFSLRINTVPVVPGIEVDKPPVVGGSVTSVTFRLPVHLRNDSVEALLGITHVYLFTRSDAPIVPCEYVADYSTTSLNLFGTALSPSAATRPVSLEAFVANAVDAPDGLASQYRLPTKFPSMPPGAIEEANIQMMFRGGATKCDAVYRLRLHSARQYHDYAFRLVVDLKPEGTQVAAEEVAEEPRRTRLKSVAKPTSRRKGGGKKRGQKRGSY